MVAKEDKQQNKVDKGAMVKVNVRTISIALSQSCLTEDDFR